MKRLALLALVSLPCMLTLGLQAAPISPVVQYTTTGTLTDTRPFTLGYSFSTTTTFDINALGVWDNGNGMSQEVGIWNSSGTLLVSTTVSGASSPIDGFQWNSVSYMLGPGTYTIGATYDGGTFPANAAGLITQPGYTWITDEYAAGTGLNFPNITTNGSYGTNGILWADFSAGTPPVPEPTSLMLFGSGLLGVVGAMRRKFNR